MGQTLSVHEKEKGDVLVGTLNYGGILNSPFEFYSNEQDEERKISDVFVQLLPKYYPDFSKDTFAWKIGKIDQKIQKQRYTPIYSATVGVQEGKFISKQQFTKRWNSNFQEALKKSKLDPPPTQAQTQTMRNFDMLCYHSLLRFVYGINEIDDVKNQVDVNKYLEFTKRYFSRSYLDEKRKIQKLDHAFQKSVLDVILLQEPTAELLKHLGNQNKYHLEFLEDDTSTTLVNKQSFARILGLDKASQQLFKFTPQEMTKLKANKETRIVFCDKYIIINAHLSSKAQKNKKELAELKQAVKLLKEKCKQYDLIIGGDLNAYIDVKDFSEGLAENDHQKYYTFPLSKDQMTTCKKRTCLQPQFNKANKAVSESKDQFMTTLQIQKSSVQTIDMKSPSDKVFLPTQNHPFDHFLVTCLLKAHK